MLWYRFWPVPTSLVPGIAGSLFKDEHLFLSGSIVVVTLYVTTYYYSMWGWGREKECLVMSFSVLHTLRV